MKKSFGLRLTAVAIVVVLGGALVLAAVAETTPAGNFDALAAGYLDAFFEAHPVRATQLGVHDHDGALPDFSRGGIHRRTKELRIWLSRLDSIDRTALDRDRSFDHRILDRAIRAELLELEEIRGWQHNPMLYTRVLATGAASLIDREFGTLDRRVADLSARLNRFSHLIGTCKKNLRDVPQLWAELALQNIRGTVAFLRDDVPPALAAQGLDRLDPQAASRWRKAHRRGIQRLEAFAAWLELSLLPRADGDFRLGAELFERKLLYEEHVELSIERLVEMNEAEIERYRQWVSLEARRIDPDRADETIMDEIARDFPSPEELIPTARRNVLAARDFVVERALVTLPTERLPIVRPTPEYARMGFASMSTPGPFESEATEAYYNITNVDSGWSAEQQAQHLTYFNRPGLLGISVHEAMPGHYVQLLYQRDLPTDVRKVFSPSSLTEGWAHYVEQMMVDEGFGGGEPDVRLAQLRRALQRQARWYAGVALHARDVSIEEAAERFAEIAYFAPFPALRETRRATYDPTYLYYALGRLQILELREEYRRFVESRGEVFSLREFHDRLLGLGLPISLAREALLSAD